MPLEQGAIVALLARVEELLRSGGNADSFIFSSRSGVNRPLTRIGAWRVLKRAFRAAGLSGKLATHTMRKTFAARMRELVGGDMMKLKELMGHKALSSTAAYVQVDEGELRALVLKKW